MTFVDSSVLIAAGRTVDQHHARAAELLIQHQSELLITDHILAETLTVLAKHDGASKALDYARRILAIETVRLLYNNPQRNAQALSIIAKYHDLSFCDALSVYVMQENRVHKILSFDSDFDHIPAITRIY